MISEEWKSQSNRGGSLEFSKDCTLKVIPCASSFLKSRCLSSDSWLSWTKSDQSREENQLDATEMCDYSHNFPHPGRIACCPAPNSRPPVTKALHTIRGNNTSIVSSSWWWEYKCPKHVEQIISAIKHSVATSWFSSLRLYYDERTDIHQRATSLRDRSVVQNR